MPSTDLAFAMAACHCNGMLKGWLCNAGNNTQGVYDQYPKAVQLRPDIGFDLLSAA